MDTIIKKAAQTYFEFERAPHLVVNPSGQAPLAAELSFEAPLPVSAEITITDGVSSWAVPTPPKPDTLHSHILLGMRPDQIHSVILTLRDSVGGIYKEVWRSDFQTDPLPDDFPELKLSLSEPAAMEPGFTFFGLRKSHRSGAANYGVILALDADGEVVWLCNTGHTVGEIKRLRNGNLIYLTFDNRAIELDMLGNRVCQWFAAGAPNAGKFETSASSIPVAAEAFHHDISELDNGNFIVLGIERRKFADYPTSETVPDAPKGPALVVGDVVVEFQRNGDVAGAWRMLDILDAERIGYGSLSDYWGNKGVPDSMDWSHLNSVYLDTSDDSFIVSSRHQDAVIKFRRDTGAIVWILGNHDGWRAPWSDHLLNPEGAHEWQYHQHHATITPRGTILLFDNGNHRAHPFKAKQSPADSFSRAAEFSIDQATSSVKQVWSYGDGGADRYFCPFICGAEEMPHSGNVLVCFGGLMSDDNGAPIDDPRVGLGWIRIVEVTHEENPRTVFELFIDERGKGNGWDVYRAHRLPALYG
ncbi:MAG: aryl-sulfate sulfotransferase [Rhodospirillales bacterium]|nr:aryl-sulfate sulfotransferase [Rhodospirillales bacterium]